MKGPVRKGMSEEFEPGTNITCLTLFGVYLEKKPVRYRTLPATPGCSILLAVEYPFPPVGIVWRGGRQKPPRFFLSV